jgi:hypothetical protein
MEKSLLSVLSSHCEIWILPIERNRSLEDKKIMHKVARICVHGPRFEFWTINDRSSDVYDGRHPFPPDDLVHFDWRQVCSPEVSSST